MSEDNKCAVLDKGFVRLVDSMGNDASVVQAARVSYGAGTKTVREDEALIRYLLRHRHTSVFEQVLFKFHVKAPIFIIRQWFRHRTFCLSGDTRLVFDLPNVKNPARKRCYPKTLKSIYEAWQPSKAVRDRGKNSLFKRQRIQQMQLRCIDTSSLVPRHTQIKDIWQSGVKSVYSVTVGKHKIKASEDHLFYTDKGWLQLKTIMSEPNIKVAMLLPKHPSIISKPVEHDYTTEMWEEMVDWPEYKVSSFGRVKRVGKFATGKIKLPTRRVISVSRNGKTITKVLAREVLKAFTKTEGQYACHRDGNIFNNSIENLYWGTPQENSQDRFKHDTNIRLATQFLPVKEVVHIGEEMTYDIEVADVCHNFSAENFIVHNSVNELSLRYSEAPEDYYLPAASRIQAQSATNKQGSGDVLDEATRMTALGAIRAHSETALREYEHLLHLGVSRELARMVLPTNWYSEFYATVDLHNLMHFLNLRLKPNAQWEIRQYAEAMLRLIQPIVPASVQAFQDYIYNGKTIGQPLLQSLQAYKQGKENYADGLSKSEALELPALIKEFYDGSASKL